MDRGAAEINPVQTMFKAVGPRVFHVVRVHTGTGVLSISSATICLAVVPEYLASGMSTIRWAITSAATDWINSGET